METIKKNNSWNGMRIAYTISMAIFIFCGIMEIRPSYYSYFIIFPILIALAFFLVSILLYWVTALLVKIEQYKQDGSQKVKYWTTFILSIFFILGPVITYIFYRHILLGTHY